MRMETTEDGQALWLKLEPTKLAIGEGFVEFGLPEMPEPPEPETRCL